MGEKGVKREQEQVTGASRIERKKVISEQKEVTESMELTEVKAYAKKRITSILFKLLLFLGAIILSLVVGAIIGYSVIGKGAVSDVFNSETWQHIFELVRKGK